MTRKKHPKSITHLPPSFISLSQVVRSVDPDIFQFSKVLEMDRSVYVIVEALGYTDIDVDATLLLVTKSRSHERPVPSLVIRDEEHSSDTVGKKKLRLLTEAGARVEA
jgi:hypothetical protein